MGPVGWQLPHNRAQSGAAYQVRVYVAVVLAGLPGSRNAGIVLSPAGALNFSDAQIKRPAHAG
jgi:hypothetical protein